jgi:PAS domain S-box-containing protein/putative nucleotidyltransferase with HDIG domain
MLLIEPETGEILDANQAAADFYGYPKSKLCGMFIGEINTLSSEQMAAELQKALVEERNYFIFPHRLASGEERIVEVHSSPITLQDKQALFSVIHDVTEHKQAEKQSLLQNSILNATANAILVTDRNAVITWVNPAFSTLTGYTLEEAINKKPRELVRSGKQDIDFYKNMWRILMSGEVWQGEIINRRKNGSLYTEEMTITPLKDADGAISHFIAVKQDISARKQADERLRESEEKHRTFIEQTSECITLIDEQGSIIEWNHAREMLTGLKREDVLGKPYWDIRLQLSPPKMRTAEVLQRFKSNTLEMLQTGRSPFLNRIHEGKLVTANGERKIVDQIIFPIKTKNGYCIGSVLSDITARKRAEEALKQSEAHYHLLADHVTDKVWLMDMNLKLTYVSPSVEKRRGYTFEELQQLPLEQNLTPASFEMVMKVFAEESPKVMADPSYSLDRTLELEFCQKDGSTFWEENKLSIIRDENGRPVSILGEGRDITERKMAQDALRESEEKYRLIAENTSDGIIIFGADSCIQYVSPAYISQLGYSEKEELGRTPENIFSLIHPDDREAVFADIYKAIELKKSELTYSYRVRHRAGHYIWREDNARFNYDPSGNYCGTNVICRDITERRQAEESIRQRVLELETLNRISLVLRSVTKQEEMLTIVMDEALSILNTSHGSISLYNKTTDTLEKIITRGWTTQVIEPPQSIHEGIAGKVFTSGGMHISREFASDPDLRAASRTQIPDGWGGICLPIRTSQQTLGVINVSVSSERELDKDEIRLLSILSEITGSALQRMQLHEQTVRRLEQLHALRAVDQAIASNLDMRLTLDILIDHTVSQLGVDAVAVLLLPPGMNLLELAAHRGFHTHLFNSTSLSESFALQAIVAHRLISANEFEVVNKNQRIGKFWKEEGFACYWCVPLIVKGEVKGVLEVYHRTAFTPDAEWIEFLEALAGQAAIAIDSTQLFENLQRANLDLNLAYDATIEGWSRAMDLRDHETEGHTLRVTDLTLKLARAMRISESQLTALRRGALLHDIGKMGVPDAILLKEGDLTDEEWMLMRQHPQLAHDMLAPIAYLNDALNIPYCHHEKWDGTGYPQGLKEDHIPLAARIFAIVDVWDALTSDRVYRKKWTRQKTLAYIKDQNRRHFDPQVVEVFFEIMGKA